MPFAQRGVEYRLVILDREYMVARVQGYLVGHVGRWESAAAAPPF
jgi:hypothetical protein